MVSIARTTSKDVTAFLHFYNPPLDGEEPFFKVTDSSGTGFKNYSHDPRSVLIRDIRNHESSFTLEEHSFAAVFGPATDEIDFNDPTDITSRYRPLVERMIMQQMKGAATVVFFDSTIRSAISQEHTMRPVRKVHIDQSPFGAYQRAKMYLPRATYEEVMARRVRLRLVNVWKPLNETVLDHPLVVGESSTVKNTDLVPIKHIYPAYVGETYAVKFNEGQRFWYWSEMQPDEYLIFVCFDSLGTSSSTPATQGARCAHASISLPNSTTSIRESIELRCLVLG